LEPASTIVLTSRGVSFCFVPCGQVKTAKIQHISKDVDERYDAAISR
jgi:hypothetical protein